METTVLLGKNYHSYLISFALFERNKKVVLIDDHYKDSQDPAFIFDFERVLLETWGLDCNIPLLLELDNYLTPSPYCLIYNGKRLNLGNSPSENFNEIIRKFPNLLSLDPLKDERAREKFDHVFETFSEKFGVKFFRFVELSALKIDMMWELLPQELKDIFFDFKEQSKKEELNFLFCFFQGIYQHQFFKQRSDFELLFILLFLLSPRFEINRKKFEEDLSRFFKKGGGETISGENISFETKGSEVNQLSISGKDPIKLEKLFLTGSNFLGVSLAPDSKSCLTSIKMRLNLKNLDLLNQEFFLSDDQRIGGVNPLTRIRFEKDALVGEVLIPYMPGDKEAFDEKVALKILLGDLEKIQGEHTEKDLRLSSSFTQNYWSQDLENKSISTYFWPFFPQPVKNLNIYPPLKSGPLGTLSVLAQIKDQRGHII
jgi:hypothetical protein